MECSTPTFDVNLDPAGFLIDLDSLYAHLAGLRDKRDARGVRYALVSVLVFLVLAKLAGQDRLLGVKGLTNSAFKVTENRLDSHGAFKGSGSTISDIEEVTVLPTDTLDDQASDHYRGSDGP